MKKTLYKSRVIKALVLVLIPVMFLLTTAFYRSPETGASGISSVSRLIPAGRDFVNMIFNLSYYGMAGNAWWSIYRHMPYYRDSLNFNAIHIYGGGEGGSFDSSVSSYSGALINLMDSVEAAGLKGYYGRSKIEKLCYSQRIVYEITSPPGNNTVNRGFCYQNTTGVPLTDSGRTVLYACPDCPPTSSSSAGWLCYNIYENLQHNDLLDFQEGDKGDWHIKPVMRINKSDFDNPAKRDLPVVKINTVNFQGDTISSVILRVWNFRQGNDYNGQYIEKYTFEFGDDSLHVSGRYDTVNGLSLGYINNKSLCKVDFKIYWFGQVAVWLDKVVVDDDRANGMFEGNYDCKMIEETTPEMFLLTGIYLKEGKFSISNYPAVNYVMNVMYSKLQNEAVPISLK